MGSIIGIQNVFGDSNNISTQTIDYIEITISSDKAIYGKNEDVNLNWYVKNVGTNIVNYTTRSTCGNGVDSYIFDSNGNRLTGVLPPSAKLVDPNDIRRLKLGVSFYGSILEQAKDNPEETHDIMILTSDIDTLKQILRDKHGATKLSEGRTLGFVSARIPVKEIPLVADYAFVGLIGDAEARMCGTAEVPKQLSPEETIFGTFKWSQLLSSGKDIKRAAQGQYLFEIVFADRKNHLTFEINDIIKSKPPLVLDKKQPSVEKQELGSQKDVESAVIVNNTQNSKSIDTLWYNPETLKFNPPLVMIKKGLDPAAVICNEPLNKLYKPNSNMPICVKPTTMEKLIQKGWLTVPATKVSLAKN